MSKKNTIYGAFSLLLLMVLVMPACDWFKKKTEQAVSQVKQEVGEPKFHLLDVNSSEIFNDAHIPDAVHTTIDGVEELSKGFNKSTPVVVYCSSYECGASHLVADKLKKLGFENVAVYSGGIQEWYKLSKENKAAYPLEGEAKQAFLEKEIVKVAPKEEEGIRSISAAELSKLIEESKAPSAEKA